MRKTRRFKIPLCRVLILAGAIAYLNFWWINPVQAQLPWLPQITWETFRFNQNPERTVVSACVRLDGRCVFSILDQQANLTQRIRYTEERLKQISQLYFSNENAELDVYSRTRGNDRTIYVAVDEEETPIITLYPQDVNARGVDIEHQAEQIVAQLSSQIKQAKAQRSRAYIIKQARLAVIVALAVLSIQLIIAKAIGKTKRTKDKLQNSDLHIFQPIADYINRKQTLNLQAIQYRLLQVIQLGCWLGGVLIILGLFPQTRSLQIWTIALIRIPLRFLLVALLTYIAIRLSNVLIAKLNSTLVANYVLSRDVRRRMQVRVTTIARLVGGIVAVVWVVLGIAIALTLVGINIAPLLAGAGILGLAFSFASQNIIKDALNGFFIILEDQYAVGDVINVGNFSGLVENLNLRITQLRDGQGRLITIPNSEIKTVANLSSQWSRAEIDIPITYQVDIDLALELIGRIAREMAEESEWQQQIIEPPEILGVDNFSERGSVVRVWIVTEPLRQWAVSREFRRRLQKVFAQHRISLVVSQQQIWLDSLADGKSTSE